MSIKYCNFSMGYIYFPVFWGLQYKFAQFAPGPTFIIFPALCLFWTLEYLTSVVDNLSYEKETVI